MDKSKDNNETPGSSRRFLSLEEVADLLGVEYQLIYRLVRRGELPSIKLGRIYRIESADLDAFLASRKRASGPVPPPYQCSVCGVGYASELSLKHGCTVCGDPICTECWIRRKVRQCSAHRG